MGNDTQEFPSTALTNLYPSFYKEFQIINWTHVDIVVTEADGNQIYLPQTGDIRESDACVVIEYRAHTGLRCETNGVVTTSKPLQAKRVRIPFDKFRNAPARIEDHHIVLSTVDQSLIAKDMMCESSFAPRLPENRIDMDIADPRFVFQVIDPYNQWDALLVHVFGQTVVLRAGPYGQFIPSDRPKEEVPDKGKLICYLRYPTDYYNSAKSLQTVFEISLNDIDKKEPFRLPSGDLVCIATDMTSLQEVIAKRASSTNFVGVNMIADKMISKDVYDAAVENFKNSTERMKEDFRVKLETLTTNKNSEISKLNFKIEQLTQEKEVAEAKSRQWEGIHTARSMVQVNEAKVMAEVERARKEANEASKKDLDRMWTALGCCGTLLVGVLSFATTVYVKSKK